MASFRERPKGLVSLGQGWHNAHEAMQRRVVARQERKQLEEAAQIQYNRATKFIPAITQIRKMPGGQELLDAMSVLLHSLGYAPEAQAMVTFGAAKARSAEDFLGIAMAALRKLRQPDLIVNISPLEQKLGMPPNEQSLVATPANTNVKSA